MLFLIILAVLAACFFFLNWYYLKIVLKYSQENKIIEGKKGLYKSIAFGSSYCRFGLEDRKGNEFFNFGYSAQFFYYTEKMLREYTPQCLEKGGVVYLIIADLVFAEVGKGLYCEHAMQRILSKESLGDEYSFWKLIKYRYLPLLAPELLKKTVLHLAKMRFMRDEDPYLRITDNELNEADIQKLAQNRCRDWCEQFGLSNTSSTDITDDLEMNFKKTRDILTGMIQFCLDNGYKPVLVVAPISDIMRKELGVSFMKKVLYDNICLANIQHVPFLNYLDDDRFSSYKLYNNNADFLNVTGRGLFTNVLLADTQSL